MNDPQNSQTVTQPPNPAPVPKYSHGRTGKVARLPKAARDKINQLMLEGRTYLEIIAELGEDGKDLNEDNLSNWKSGGYLDFRREQLELADIRFRHEYASEVARTTAGTGLCEATSKIMIAQILDALRDSGPTSLHTALIERPEIYVRLLNAVARLSTGTIACERYRLLEDERKAKAASDKTPASERAITPETIQSVDQLLRTH